MADIVALQPSNSFQSLYESMSLPENSDAPATNNGGHETYSDADPTDNLDNIWRATSTTARASSKLPLLRLDHRINAAAIATGSVQTGPFVLPTNNAEQSAMASGATASGAIVSAAIASGTTAPMLQRVAPSDETIHWQAASVAGKIPADFIIKAHASAGVANALDAIAAKPGMAAPTVSPKPQTESVAEPSVGSRAVQAQVSTSMVESAPTLATAASQSSPGTQPTQLGLAASAPSQTSTTAAQPPSLAAQGLPNGLPVRRLIVPAEDASAIISAAAEGAASIQRGGHITSREPSLKTHGSQQTALTSATAIPAASVTEQVLNVCDAAVFERAPRTMNGSVPSNGPIRQEALQITNNLPQSAATPAQALESGVPPLVGTDAMLKAVAGPRPAQPTSQEHPAEDKPGAPRDQAESVRSTSAVSGQSLQGVAQASSGPQNETEVPAPEPSEQLSTTFIAQSLPNISFAARAENLAFTLHLDESSSIPPRPQPTPPISPTENQPAGNTKNESSLVAPSTPDRDSSGPVPFEDSTKQSLLPVSTGSSEPSVMPPTDIRAPLTAGAEVSDPVRPAPSLAPHDVLTLQADPPKTATASQIQLQLTGNDQSSVAIRVTDRAGTANISVHASDPELRSSLRANLSDLSGQLSAQEWRNEAVKTSITVPRPQSDQDAGSSQKNFSNQQQQSADPERQWQRDRRSTSEDWQNALEEYVSGNHANHGGKQ